ncbi:MAG TPA: hypothetical protein VLA34_08425 [Candidatus Krumholzibacterium sp.]|jgi:hypothetical protein|nr:hypothetical protein [Candidatus Krumholzibacterium sp.]
MNELTEDRWSVLAPGQAKVRKERNRLPCADAKKALYCEGLRDFRVREKGLALVRTVLAEMVAIGAERAPTILFGEKATRVFQVLVDSASDSAYPLQ